MFDIKSVQYNLMKNVICNDCSNSLQDLVVTKIVLNQWIQDTIKNDLLDYFKFYHLCSDDTSHSAMKHCWNNIENKVLVSLQSLTSLPEILKKFLLHRSTLVGREILSYFQYRLIEYDNYQFCDMDSFIGLFLNKLCWTPQGSIDKRRTAKDVLECDAFGVEQKFRIACLNCLEEDIEKLFLQLPEEYFKDVQQQEYYWTDYMNRKLGRPVEQEDFRLTARDGFNYSLYTNNEVAIHYFWSLFGNSEKHRCLLSFAKNALERKRSSNIVLYLFSQLNYDQKCEILKDSSLGYKLARSLLNWRWLFLYIPTLKTISMKIGETNYLRLLYDTIENMSLFCYRQPYRDIFKMMLNDIMPRSIIKQCLEKDRWRIVWTLKQIDEIELVILVLGFASDNNEN